MTSHSKCCMLSSRDHCKVWVWSVQAVPASLMAAVHLASASQITAMQRALASLMVVLVWDTSLLWWESMEALVVSSHPMPMFISLCSQSTSSDRAPRSALGQVSDCEVEVTLATVDFSTQEVVMASDWLGQMWMSSRMATYCSSCKEVAISLGTAKSAPSNLSVSSTLVGVEHPRPWRVISSWGAGRQALKLQGRSTVPVWKPSIWRLRISAIVGQVALAGT